MHTDEDRIAELEAKVASLDANLKSVREWMNVMYGDMLRLQHGVAKAMDGDRDGGNEIYLSVQKNANLLATGKRDE